MNKTTVTFLLAAVVGNSIGVAAQTDRFANVAIGATEVAPDVYMLDGAGGNIGVSMGRDGILIIDDQFAPLAERIAYTLARLEIRDVETREVEVRDDSHAANVKYVINTHYHGDHTGGNGYFGERGATIVAHQNVRVRLLGVDDQPEAALPVITHHDGVNIYFNDEQLKVIALSGHTDGDSAVLFKHANVLHAGDLFFNGRFPYIDLDGGGGVEDYIASQQTMLGLINDETVVIPGHGPLANREDLQSMNRMIVNTYSAVKRAVASGAALDDVLTAGVDPMYAPMAWAFISERRWLETLYRAAAMSP